MRLRNVDHEFAKKITSTKGGIKGGMLSCNPTMGGDPEFFVANSRGTILASDKFFPGKENKITVDVCTDMDIMEEEQKNKLFFDGIQAEMNIGVEQCRESIADNIRKCLRVAVKRIGPNNKIILKPSVKVRKEVILTADPEARRFGCMPDFNAYTRTVNTEEIDATRHPYRYAGGHIHLGASSNYLPKTSKERRLAKTEDGHLRIIKLLDIIVGIPSLLLDNTKAAERRRSKYGKAGCFRPTPYGIEYRTPSCWWLRSPETVSLIMGLARLSWTLAANELDIKFAKLIGYDEQAIRETIDNSDRIKAKEIWEVLRPYIAIADTGYRHPLNIKSLRSSAYGHVDPKYIGASGRLPNIIDGGVPVYGLAAFEYLVDNGLNHVISNDIVREWDLSEDSTRQTTGFVSGMFWRLVENKDFQKFQSSFLKAII